MLSASLPRHPLQQMMISVTPLHHRTQMDQRDQRKTEFAVIFFDGLNQGSRLRRILSAKLGNVVHKRKCERLYSYFRPLAQNWGRRFLELHPHLMATWTSHSEIVKGTKQPQPDQISSFLDLFEKTRNQYEIHPDDIWNADEKGFMLENRTGAQKFILSQKSIQHKGRKLLAPTEDWVSTIECCNTTGQVLPPYVILKGDGVKSYRRLIPDKKTFMRYQEKGIVDEKNQLKWLTRVFIPQTAVSRKTLSKRGISSGRYTRLLLLDGHSSPISFEFVLTCWENDIIPLCIPPCTSHLLHPLDVGVLPDFTKIYTGEMRNNLHPHQLRISREVFFLLWWRSREEAMYPENVIMGWRNSGTWPVSKGVVYKRAGFDLPEARDVLDPTELKAPTNKEEFYTLLDQMLSSPPETSTQLREFLMDCFYQRSRSVELLQENLSNHYDVQVDIERDLPETDAEVTKRRAEDDPAARTASGESSSFKRQNMNSTPNPEPIQLSSQPIQPPNASLNAGPQPEWHSIRNSYGCIGGVLPQAGPSIHPTGPSSGTSQYPGNLWQYES